MSEVKLISPLLDGFSIGNPMSEHNGIRCCPAIKENTDRKYIVKIISIPATQAQMDALLLAGAYKDPADAMEYFSQIGEEIMREADLLKTLSKLDGFLPFEGWQMEPITRRRLGYEVYLVGSYKRSLEKYLKSHPVTHLEAINLGLDLCSALSVCRDAGAVYVALKPSNIFVSEKKEYRIGDLGFIHLDALKYTALPEKYYSPYTPPELYDPMAAVNLTVDTYAVGMILYQLYNDGALPFKGKQPSEGTFPTPVNADYEVAEIIMKAIDPDPSQRWNDPKEMGKALASYMQRNAINDIPITPHIPLDVSPEDIIPIPKTVDLPADKAEEGSEAAVSSTEEPPTALPAEEDSAEVSDNQEAVSDAVPLSPEEDTPSCAEPPTEEPPVSQAEKQEEQTGSEALSPDLSEIISKADDLISHETPAGVILPVIPEEPDPFGFVTEDSDEIDDLEFVVNSAPAMEEEIPVETTEKREKKKKKRRFADPKYRRRAKRFAVSLILILVLSIAGMLGYLYYQNIYLQHIDDLNTEGTQNQITVTVVTQVDPSLLLVKCVDPYGNVRTQRLSGGSAAFTDLNPNTMYSIQVEMDGFHKLTGKTFAVFTTDSNTKITSFTSVAGSEDGSLVLNFTVDGDEPRDWAVFYSTEEEQEKRHTFTGHTVTIDGLTIGKRYTFRLDPGENIALSGETTIEVMATKLILAEELAVSSTSETDITITWKTPGDVIVETWNVRCYNDIGYDETLTVTENTATFSGIDPSASYIIEVTASGMTQSAKTNITADPLYISNLNIDDRSHKKLKLTWDYTGTAPEGGWIVTYRIANSEKKILTCKKPSAEISPKIPGAKYSFTIQAADSTTVFNSLHSYTVSDAEPFNKHNLTADRLTVGLIETPEEDPWYCENISTDLLTDTFAPGTPVSVVLRSTDSFYLTGAEVNILYIIEDSYGNILPDYIMEDTVQWKTIWTGGDVKNGELNLPSVPRHPGDYVLHIYFDGMLTAQLPLIISQ